MQPEPPVHIRPHQGSLLAPRCDTYVPPPQAHTPPESPYMPVYWLTIVAGYRRCSSESCNNCSIHIADFSTFRAAAAYLREIIPQVEAPPEHP